MKVDYAALAPPDPKFKADFREEVLLSGPSSFSYILFAFLQDTVASISRCSFDITLSAIVFRSRFSHTKLSVIHNQFVKIEPF